MAAVPRLPLLVASLVTAILAAGCSSEPAETTPAAAAPPQSATLDWVERSPPTGPALVFRVFRFAVTRTGWEADVEVENGTEVARELGADPVSGGTMLVKDGRFGPYVTDGEVNATLRKGDEPDTLTAERAADLLAEKRAKGPSTKKTARKAPAKKATKKTAAKKAPAKKTAAKKTAAKKTTAKAAAKKS